MRSKESWKPPLATARRLVLTNPDNVQGHRLLIRILESLDARPMRSSSEWRLWISRSNLGNSPTQSNSRAKQLRSRPWMKLLCGH